MTGEKLYELFGEIDETYVEEAGKPVRSKKAVKVRTKSYGTVAAAACIGLIILGTAVFHRPAVTDRPEPEYVQTANPLIEVSSAEEMENYLDFQVPVLNKEVDAYIVIVTDGYPTCGRIEYKDQSTFNMEYGTGDISGIYGGVFDREETIHGVTVRFYTYSDDTESIRYALWEKDGFTFSLSGSDNLEQEIQTLTE